MTIIKIGQRWINMDHFVEAYEDPRTLTLAITTSTGASENNTSNEFVLVGKDAGRMRKYLEGQTITLPEAEEEQEA